jgi:hypothetical protein
MAILRVLKNRILLRLGFVMVNRHGFTVYLKDGKQVCSNPNRKYYSMDDKGWCTLDEYFKRNYKNTTRI